MMKIKEVPLKKMYKIQKNVGGEFSHSSSIMIRGAYNSLVWLPLPTDSGPSFSPCSTVSLATPPLTAIICCAPPSTLPHSKPHKVLSGLCLCTCQSPLANPTPFESLTARYLHQNGFGFSSRRLSVCCTATTPNLLCHLHLSEFLKTYLKR